MSRKTNADSDTREMLRIIRESEMKPVKPDTQSPDAIPYTAQDTLMTNVLAAAKQEFGADFNTIKNPMLYYPEDGDITLSGVIPEMNDAKFQFRYKVGDGAGCYLWSNPYLPISDKTIQTISKVNGVCKNWRDEISKSEDSKPSNYKDPEDKQDNTQGQGTMNEAEPTDQQQSAAPEPQTQPGQQAPVMEKLFRRGDDIIESPRTNRLKRGDDIF